MRYNLGSLSGFDATRPPPQIGQIVKLGGKKGFFKVSRVVTHPSVMTSTGYGGRSDWRWYNNSSTTHDVYGHLFMFEDGRRPKAKKPTEKKLLSRYGWEPVTEQHLIELVRVQAKYAATLLNTAFPGWENSVSGLYVSAIASLV